MAAPSSLDALPARNDAGEWLAVIEATQGTRHKLKYRPEWRAFVLSGVLPLGLSFPYDFASCRRRAATAATRSTSSSSPTKRWRREPSRRAGWSA